MTPILAALLLESWAGLAATPALDLETRRGTPLEERKKAQIERLAQQYDLAKYTLTRKIVIEQGAVSHSMPVLTLNCRFLEYDDAALSVYIHEQGHWVLSRHRGELRGLFEELRRALPGIPTAPPRGSGGEMDTYLHLLVILLEWQGLEDLIGPDRAKAVLDFKKTDHYTAIYEAVLENRERLQAIQRRHRIAF